MTATPLRLAAREAGQGSPVVLLHGLFGQAGNFGAIQRRLAAAHRVIALDLRNHGDSPHADAMNYPGMAADVHATLAALNALPAAVIGHSMGGKVAMALALARPEAVAQLCVVDIAPRAYAADLGRYAQAMAGLRLRPGLSRAEADRALADGVPEPAVRQFLLQNLRLDRDPPAWRLNLAAIAAQMAEISGWPDDLAGHYPGPTLVVAGARSDYVRDSDMALMEALFPRARLVRIDGAGHWVHAEAPGPFLHVVAGFLAG
jgi:pimeloyl-ACP methyl ester carboxylesterase